MKLYSYPISSSAWRARVALAYKGIDHEVVDVDLLGDRGDYDQVNPLSQVPVLELDDGTRISQSLAIIAYLEAVQPDPPLLGRAPLERARISELSELINAGIQPLQNLYVEGRVAALGGDGKAWSRHFNLRGLAAAEKLAASCAGHHAVGDAISQADVMIVPQLAVARRLGLDLEPYPTLRRIEAACAEHPAFVAAAP